MVGQMLNFQITWNKTIKNKIKIKNSGTVALAARNSVRGGHVLH